MINRMILARDFIAWFLITVLVVTLGMMTC
jgi:hypothetical protein